MDWIIGIGMMALGIAVVVLLWRNYCLRKEAAQFAGKVEQALDAIVTGKEWKRQGELTDSLWDRIETQLAKAEHVFQRKQEESLREKETVKGLISDISHQTRTPLANMKLYVELLEEETLSGEGTGFLAKLCEQTEKMDFLMQSMVKMSRLETGILQIRQEKQDLSGTIRRAVADVVPAAAAKEIDLFVDCPDGMMGRFIFPWRDRRYSGRLPLRIREKELPWNGRHRFLRDFTGNRRFTINPVWESDYILPEGLLNYRRATLRCGQRQGREPASGCIFLYKKSQFCDDLSLRPVCDFSMI